MKICVPKWWFAAMLLLDLGHANLALGADTQFISMKDVVADPQPYAGQKIRVTGFLRLEPEGNALYLSRDDFNKSAARHALWLDLTNAQLRSLSKLNNGRVIVEGTFSTNYMGHGGRWAGALRQVVRIRMWRMQRRR
jgi:hypothetical protein